MSFRFAPSTPRRRPSLTPMIDVVFLLLVFFMLAARFGQDAEITLTTATGGHADWIGPPRLVDIGADTLRLNGVSTGVDAIAPSLIRLVETESDPILLRPANGVNTQRLIDIMAVLQAEGLSNLVLVQP